MFYGCNKAKDIIQFECCMKTLYKISSKLILYNSHKGITDI